MTEQAKGEARRSFWQAVLNRSLKSAKDIIRLLGLILFLLIAPYIIAVSVNFFKLVICGNLNMSDFIVDLETNGISSVSNFYLGIVENISGLVFRLTH